MSHDFYVWLGMLLIALTIVWVERRMTIIEAQFHSVMHAVIGAKIAVEIQKIKEDGDESK